MNLLCSAVLFWSAASLVLAAGCGKNPDVRSDAPVSHADGTSHEDSPDVGADVPVFPPRFALPDAKTQEKYKRLWDEGRKDAPVVDRNGVGKDFPFRDGVSLAWAAVGPVPSIILARDEEVCAKVTWDNIGYFLKRVQTAEQCQVVIGVLHADDLPWPIPRLTAQEVSQVVKEIDENGKGLPLKVLCRTFDHDGFDAKCVEKNGCWFVDFAMIEELSVIEFKYIIDSQNRVARSRRVIVEGAESPSYGDVYEGTGSVKERESALKYERCGDMLWRSAYLPGCLRALKGGDSTARLNAAGLIYMIGHSATAAIPDLIRAFANPQPKVASRSSDALCRIGLAAVPELRKATKDPNPSVREWASRTLGNLRPSTRDSIANLNNALNNPDLEMRRAAAKAIEQIEYQGIDGRLR